MLAVAVLHLAGCRGEDVPDTEIYLLPLRATAGGIEVGEPRNITGRPGYDNQPAFLPESGSLLYTAIGEDGQADIWRYGLDAGLAQRITDSPEREYSPTVLPQGGGISVVRVESDGTQRLWRFDDGTAEAHLVAPEVAGVGYHLWIDPGTVVLYILPAAENDPATLEILDLATGRRRVLARAIGRSLARVPGRGTLSFVDMNDAENWWVSELDPISGKSEKLVKTLPGCEDYAWTPDGTLLMPCGSALHQWSPGSSDWRLVVDLARHGLHGLTRVAVSPNGRWMALVGLD